MSLILVWRHQVHSREIVASLRPFFATVTFPIVFKLSRSVQDTTMFPILI